MKKLILSLLMLLVVPSIGGASTRKIYINFDNQPSINASTGEITPNIAPSQGIIRVMCSAGDTYPAVLGIKSQYITGRGGTGYALSGVINNAEGQYTGTWPYVEWANVAGNVSWSNEIYVSFWMKYINYRIDQSFKPYQNIKLFYWKFSSASDSSLMGEIAAGASPNGTPPPYNEYTLSWRGAAPYTDHMLSVYPSYSDSDGNWHHYEFHLNRGAGRAKWWIDGNLIMDWNPGYPNLGDSNLYIQWIAIAGSIVGASPNSMGTRAFDDIEVWDGMPSNERSYLPPKAPINLKIN